MPLRLRAVTCEVLARPVYLSAARTPNTVDVTLLRQRLHDTPATLRELLQGEIDAASTVRPAYDAVVLAYGLCGGAAAGIVARDLPVVLPRAHDCITLMLGGRDRYDREPHTITWPESRRVPTRMVLTRLPRALRRGRG